MSDRIIQFRWGLGTFIFLVFVCSSVLLSSHTATAVTTVPTKMNFQGRLTNSAGNTLTNGTYNMTFRLFTASSGGSAVWTEVRAVSGGTGVAVANGLFSVRLGEVTTLPASLFASGTLYLEVELPTPATATTSSPSYTEGAMTPRNQMATSAYSYNSETLDGFDSADFAQLTASNTFTGVNTFRNTSDSTSAFRVQNAAGVSVLSVDTTNTRVLVGSGTATEKLDVIGNFRVRDASTATKSTRIRTNTTDLNFEAGGDSIQFSTWSGADFTGTQYNQFMLNADGSPIDVQRAMDLVNAVTTDVALKITGAASQSADIFQVKAGVSTTLMSVGPTGATTLKNSSNSTGALMVQNAAGNELFQIDSTNSRVYMGDTTADATGVLLVLDTKNTSGDPTGVDGGMYYNSNTSDFRCYVNGGWQSCQAHSGSVNGVSGGGSNATTTYTNLPTPSSISYTKLGGSNTNLVITLTASMYTSGTTPAEDNRIARIGINVGGGDVDCGSQLFSKPNIWTSVSCTVVVPGLSAGAKTIQARWKMSGLGTINMSAGNGWNTMTVIETN